MEKSPKTIKIPTFLALNQSRSLSGPSKFILKNEKLHQEELLKKFFFLAQFTRTENMSIPKKKKRKKKKKTHKLLEGQMMPGERRHIN